MILKVEDLIASVGIAPKIGQVPTSPVGNAGWSKPPVKDSHDLQRVLKLPRRDTPTEAEEQQLIEQMTAKYRRDRTGLGPCRCKVIRPEEENPCITEFRMAQAWALLELELVGGVLGSIGVGHGKTLLEIMAPMAMPNCQTALLLVPPRLVTQLITEYELASEHFNVPGLIVHNGTNYSKPIEGRPILRVMPYSRLSRKTATTFIEKIKPDFLFADEVHKLKDRNTATASRVLRYFVAHPETRFAGWTGSLTDKSLNDYGHLAALALRFNSPLPLDPVTLDDWARAIDPSDFPAPAGALFEMCEPGESIHSGYRRRLTETMGVVATSRAAIDAHLVITERKAPPIPTVIKDALSQVRDSWQRPDGEEFVEAHEVARCTREVACGFYYRWTFPRGETDEQIKNWLALRKVWNKELRLKLQAREVYLDSVELCEEAAARAWTDSEVPGLPTWRAESWPAWRKVKGTVKPETEAVRIDPYLAQDAADWGLSKRGVIWYGYSAFGNWVGELSGLPVHGGGPKSDVIIGREKGDRSIIASIHAHGTGRDGLQRLFETQLIANPPSSAQSWEQLLGRLHRIGQSSDMVTAEVYRHTKEFRSSIDKAMGRALYVQETLGSEQKLRAGYDMSE